MGKVTCTGGLFIFRYKSFKLKPFSALISLLNACIQKMLSQIMIRLIFGLLKPLFKVIVRELFGPVGIFMSKRPLSEVL